MRAGRRGACTARSTVCTLRTGRKRKARGARGGGVKNVVKGLFLTSKPA